jgi:hypothetical protein
LGSPRDSHIITNIYTILGTNRDILGSSLDISGNICIQIGIDVDVEHWGSEGKEGIAYEYPYDYGNLWDSLIYL